MLIGRGRGPGSANIHATVPGRIIRIDSWKSAGGRSQEGIVIRMEGSFEKLGKPEEIFPWEGMPPYDIQRTISDYGVVEMEGRGRPVSDTISSIRSTPDPVTMVVRCVFDDPWLASDFVLCRERAAAVVEGAAITARSCRISRIIYAISHKEKDLGEKFIAFNDKWRIPASVVLVGSRYPQRNRRELELVLRNYEKHEGLQLGTLFFFGPATLAAVYDAVKLRKPPLERYITVGGSAVKKPQVLKVRIGKRIGDIFSECGGFSGDPKRIAFGSPLLGQPLSNLDEPVIKTSYALFAMLTRIKHNNQSSCISCGECRNVCPVGLDPEELYKKAMISGIAHRSSQRGGQKIPPGQTHPLAASSSNSSSSSQAIPPACHGCGCCEVVCPSSLPLNETITSCSLRGD
jgi:electron transport complex protein RnfC